MVKIFLGLIIPNQILPPTCTLKQYNLHVPTYSNVLLQVCSQNMLRCNYAHSNMRTPE